MKSKNIFKNINLIIIFTFTIICLPFIVDLKNINNELDFFLYYKNELFFILSIIALGMLAFKRIIFKNKLKGMLLYVPLVVYIICLVLSYIFSLHIYRQFADVFILIGYITLSIYIYQVMDYMTDYKKVVFILLILNIIFLIITLTQLNGYDIFKMSFIKNIINSGIIFTFGNVNDITIFAAMFIPFFMSFLLYENTQPHMKLLYMALIGALFIVLFSSKSRQIIFLTFLTCIFIIVIFKKNILKNFYFLIILLGTIFLAYMNVDIKYNFELSEKFMNIFIDIKDVIYREIEYIKDYIPTLKQNIFIGTGVNIIKKDIDTLYMDMILKTGLISCIAFILFYLIYLFCSCKLYLKNGICTYTSMIGVACLGATFNFMLVTLFVYPNIDVMILFWFIIGMGQSINYRLAILDGNFRFLIKIKNK